MTSDPPDSALLRTPLHALHESLGARLVPFAGYALPVQFPAGVLAEHRHVRSGAGLFDVSHMGQIRLGGPDAMAALETLVPADFSTLAPGRTRYTLLLDESGGIIDDLMVTNAGTHLDLVVNGATKEGDLAHLKARIGDRVAIEARFDRALLALQGPAVAALIATVAADLGGLAFMQSRDSVIGGIPVAATRSGYTGEDGFELSCAPDRAEALARLLLAQPGVAPIGLGARDSLRLEAGLCLYGHDIDLSTNPVEADLGWAIGKRRRARGGFPGADTILAQLASGPPRRRVGIQPEGKAPAREGTLIQADGRVVGRITSGGFGPSADRPVAMGYVETGFAAPGSLVDLMVRGTPRAARIAALPFVPHRYHRA